MSASGWATASKSPPPRGAFLLRPGSRQVVLLSAGIGATPVLAMLYAIAENASTRSVWWVYGARNGDEHPFAGEVSNLLQTLPDGRRHIAYSRPLARDQPGVDFDAEGHLGIEALRRLDVSRDADFYLCGPEGFMRDMTSGLATWGVPQERIRTENFGPGQAITPGIVGQPARSPHPPSGRPVKAPRCRSRAAGSTSTGVTSTPACSNSPKPAMSPSDGPAAPACATHA